MPFRGPHAPGLVARRASVLGVNSIPAREEPPSPQGFDGHGTGPPVDGFLLRPANLPHLLTDDWSWTALDHALDPPAAPARLLRLLQIFARQLQYNKMSYW
jgi:hypothetical protein